MHIAWAPQKVLGDHTFESINAGWYTTCGVDFEGVAWCWGQGTYGVLGDRIADDHVSGIPVRVQANQPIQTIQLSGWNSACALYEDSKVRCWGYGPGGSLGDGSPNVSPHYANPVPTEISGGHLFESLHTNWGLRFCGIGKLDGRIWCWGAGIRGELGNGTWANSSVPVDVTEEEGSPRFATVVSGMNHTCALDDLNKAWCWGEREYGAVGDGLTTPNVSQPVLVAGEHEFVALFPAYDRTCAIDAANELWCWGRSGGGWPVGVGDGVNTERIVSTPVRIGDGRTFG